MKTRLSQLDIILDQVRTQHPLRRGEEVEPPRSMIEEVRISLQSCPYEGVSDLAYRLSPKQLLACLEIIVIDREGEVPEKAADILRLRPRDQSIRKAWFKLVRIYPNKILEKLVRDLIQKRGISALTEDPKVSPKVALWFVSGRLSRAYSRITELGNCLSLFTEISNPTPS